jgi:hypothetical protein
MEYHALQNHISTLHSLRREKDNPNLDQTWRARKEIAFSQAHDVLAQMVQSDSATAALFAKVRSLHLDHNIDARWTTEDDYELEMYRLALNDFSRESEAKRDQKKQFKPQTRIMVRRIWIVGVICCFIIGLMWLSAEPIVKKIFDMEFSKHVIVPPSNSKATPPTQSRVESAPELENSLDLEPVYVTIGALFSGLALLGIIIAIFFQLDAAKTMHDQVDVLRDQSETLNRQSRRLSDQVSLISKQTNAISQTLAGNLMNRLYEIDKMIMSYPTEFAFFIDQTQRTTSYFYDKSIERDATYYRVKAIVYFHIDFFDEILACGAKASDSGVSNALEIEAWHRYILQRMTHALIKEVLKREQQSWGEELKTFLEKHKHALEKPCDPDHW